MFLDEPAFPSIIEMTGAGGLDVLTWPFDVCAEGVRRDVLMIKVSYIMGLLACTCSSRGQGPVSCFMCLHCGSDALNKACEC